MNISIRCGFVECTKLTIAVMIHIEVLGQIAHNAGGMQFEEIVWIMLAIHTARTTKFNFARHFTTISRQTACVHLRFSEYIDKIILELDVIFSIGILYIYNQKEKHFGILEQNVKLLRSAMHKWIFAHRSNK